MDVIEAMQTNHRRVAVENCGSDVELTYLTYGMLIRAMVQQGNTDWDFIHAQAQWEHVCESWQGPHDYLRRAFRLGYADPMSATGGHEAPKKLKPPMLGEVDPRSLPGRAVPRALTRYLGI